MSRIQAAVESLPRIRIVTANNRYLHAEVSSWLLRFVDDLEVLIESDGELVVRSASRVGRGDLGVNRRRVERIRSALTEAGLISDSAP